ncbi:unnamed protein product, partial [Heterobilharzia americana]
MANYPYPMQNFFAHNPYTTTQLSCLTQSSIQQMNKSSFFSISQLSSLRSVRDPLLEDPCTNKNLRISSSSADISKMSLCEVNLDDVPMELVTSEEDSESEYTDAFLSAYTDPEDDSLVQNCTAELDEIELRSRALRSMLLQKKTSTVDKTLSKP